jgi:hypothetical protein
MNPDEVLREYVAQPVPLGMEARILARCRRRVWWRRPVVGLALAAAGLMGLVWVRPARAPERNVRGAVRRVVSEDAGRKPGVRSEAPPRARRKRRVSGVEALVRFARQHPEQAARLVEFHDPEPMVPLEITPIAIEELGDSTK